MDNTEDEKIRALQQKIRDQYQVIAVMFPHWLGKGAPVDVVHIDVLAMAVKMLGNTLNRAHAELTSRKSDD